MNSHSDKLLHDILHDEHYQAAYADTRRQCLSYLHRQRCGNRIGYRLLPWAIAAALLLIAASFWLTWEQTSRLSDITVQSYALNREQICVTYQTSPAILVQHPTASMMVDIVPTKAKVEIVKPLIFPKLAVVSPSELPRILGNHPLLLVDDDSDNGRLILLTPTPEPRH